MARARTVNDQGWLLVSDTTRPTLTSSSFVLLRPPFLSSFRLPIIDDPFFPLLYMTFFPSNYYDPLTTLFFCGDALYGCAVSAAMLVMGVAVLEGSVLECHL